MNDTINARMDWLEQYQADKKKREEDAAKGAIQKMMEAKQASAKKAVIWVVIIMTSAPIITYLEYLIYLKLTKG